MDMIFEGTERGGIIDVEGFVKAVMELSPEEVAKMINTSGVPIFTARALGYACRYRGIEMVKVLAEGGAKFERSLIEQMFADDFSLGRDPEQGAHYTALLDRALLKEARSIERLNETSERPLPLLPREERLGILEYLIENGESIGFDTDEMLCFACLQNEREFVSAMKNAGVSLSEELTDDLVEYPGSLVPRLGTYLGMYSDEEFISAVSGLLSEVGAAKRKICFTRDLWTECPERFQSPELLRFIVENFKIRSDTKVLMLRDLILEENIPCLEIAADAGWLTPVDRREKIMRFSSAVEANECTSWLLDYITRNFDLAAERERADRRRQRLLSSAPNSITAMRNVWKWKKRPDGSVIITDYIGSEDRVTVPEKIGRRTVTAIGDGAFSPDRTRPRQLDKQGEVLRGITEITLPDTVTEIGEEAFSCCSALERINIPDGVSRIPFCMMRGTNIDRLEISGNVKTICGQAFEYCSQLSEVILHEGTERISPYAFFKCDSLRRVVLPRSIHSIDEEEFAYFPTLTIEVYEGSYAAEYCHNNGIACVYIEE